jgi:[glutamine synthetase] adenylyltransferase / [glutamine synthetase]-adenylyl-L-tyrosine phosphorylase
LPTHLTVAEARHRLTTFKAHELFRICVRHLVHPGHAVHAFAAELTALADVVLAGALDLAQRTLADECDVPRLADGRPCAFAICGLGKLGGSELGYASDLDLLCVYGDPEAGEETLPSTVHGYATVLAQRLIRLLSARHADMFAPDFRLRPYGQGDRLATSYTAFRAYYRHGGHAAPFERQALIKLRWIAGDAWLGRAVETWRDAFVYSATPCDLPAIARMRQQQQRELVEHGTTNVKYGRGGLVDVEYIVQSLQLQHGATMSALRTVHTLRALAVLRHTGLLPEAEAQHLQEAYSFFRAMIDALRMVRGQAKDVVVPDERSDAFRRLARPMQSWAGQGMPESISYQLALHRQRVISLAHKYGIDAASSVAQQASA